MTKDEILNLNGYIRTPEGHLWMGGKANLDELEFFSIGISEIFGNGVRREYPQDDGCILVVNDIVGKLYFATENEIILGKVARGMDIMSDYAPYSKLF